MDAPLAERMLRALLIQLIQAEALDPNDVIDAAETAKAEGDIECSYALKTVVVEAAAPARVDWEADMRRGRFHVINGDVEGGKAVE